MNLWITVHPFGPRYVGCVMQGRECVTTCERGCPFQAAATAYAYAAFRSKNR